jgi:hypothetical protein
VAEVAEEGRLFLVDDAQRLYRVSAQTLAFVARRLLAERVALASRSARVATTESQAEAKRLQFARAWEKSTRPRTAPAL